MQIEKIC